MAVTCIFVNPVQGVGRADLHHLFIQLSNQSG
jgi:hypothetical protein